MRVFLTGATGFIGSAIIPELLKAGHAVCGLSRSETGASALIAAGARVHRGSLEDPESLSAGAAEADGVIHCAFDHDFENFVANCDKDRRAIEALASALAGSDRPLVITSGTGLGSSGDGRPATEDVFNRDYPNPRRASEIAGQAALDRGINLSVVRLPQVHDTVKQGLITPAVQIARRTGVSAYVGDGGNRWSACPVGDVARLYALALAHAKPGARYHAVAEEGVTAREIAEVVGEGLKVPVVSVSPDEAEAHFGWMARFLALDMPASSAWTREELDWSPTGPSLIEDLKRMNYAV